MKNKSFALIAALSLVLTGCTGGQQENSDEITVWHWMSDREEAFEQLGERYEAQTGVSVKFDLYAPSESYSQKVKAAAQTRTLPDVFGILGESRDLSSFIKSGYVADLSDVANDPESPWSQTLFRKAVEVNEFKAGNQYGVKPGVYGVPLDVTTIQLVYNRNLFRKAGLDPDNPPTNWVEFLAAAKALKEKDIPVLVSGFGEIWMLDALASNLAMNLMGEEKVFATYRGDIPYTDPSWVQVLNYFKQLTDEDVIVKGAVTMVNKSAEQTFANERAAMAFNGSWCVNVYQGMNPNLDYGALLPPVVNPANPMKVWGGAGSSFKVNAMSPRVEEAKQFIAWLAQKEQQAFLANSTNNLPANRESLGDVSPVLAQFADDIDNTTHPSVYPIHEYHQVSEAWAKGIQSILIREKTPEQVAQEVQAVKERELQRSPRKNE